MVATTHAAENALFAESAGSRLNGAQVIAQIQSLNPTASARYLARFSSEQLRHYLDHLTAASGPRGRWSRWTRRNETPAVVGFDARSED